tara:strand:+ start:67 stop:939 length:873 start_codon:yes stop_codon:yes gene_type:complete
MMGHRYFFLILLTLGVIRVDSFAVISSSVPAWRDNQQKSYRFSSLSPWSCSRNGIVLKGSVSDDGDNRKVDKNENGDAKRRSKVDDLVQTISLRMRRVTFLSWWTQVILTAVSSVTLMFTRNVMNIETVSVTAAAATASRSTSALVPNYFLAGSSIVLSFGSIFWTWATRRLSRRLVRKPTTRIQAANMLRKSITLGTYLNLAGMTLSILGAAQIVGSLAIKVLTTSANPAQTMYQQGGIMLIQPLDILVVQANNNTLFSHFCSIVAYLFLGRSIEQLDPPSVDDNERTR